MTNVVMPEQIVMRSIDELLPYANNSRTHSDAQIAKLAAAIREFGWTVPILVDERGTIVAGHGRLLAARKLQLQQVPTIELSHLSEAQRRAYVIADNRLALDAGWDEELLSVELQGLLDDGFDLGLTGFSDKELAKLLEAADPDAAYTQKIESPVYSPKGDCPPIESLVQLDKQRQLESEIAAADVPEDVRQFLLAAATRHAVFRFDRIAEYYCHAPADVQRLMEASALVIIDFDQAIERGFVRLTDAVAEQFASDQDAA